jgi:hypothetical protein
VDTFWFERHAGALAPVPDRADAAEKDGQKLVCYRCRNPITDVTQHRQVQGSHVHRCTNPAGITYQFACFHTAPGCSASGMPTSEHSWFPGYLWRVAVCRKCGEHLGWAFSGAGAFFGLITDRVIEG